MSEPIALLRSLLHHRPGIDHGRRKRPHRIAEQEQLDWDLRARASAGHHATHALIAIRSQRNKQYASFARVIELSDRELLKVILAADDDLLREGYEPKQRGFHVISRVMTGLGYHSFILAGENAPPIVTRIQAIHTSLYRASDVAIGGLHSGVFMFRDIFVRVDIPFIYGSVTLNPSELTDLNEMQLRWLQSKPEEYAAFQDQFVDIFDFAGGIGGLASYRRPSASALPFLQLAAFQLQAAAATLRQSFDPRGAIQSAIIGAELALKGGLIATGVKEADLGKKFGHNLAEASNVLATAWAEYDRDRVSAAIKRLPAYVKNRYSADQPKRFEAGQIAMNAQYIAGEVMRQVTGHSIRPAMQTQLERIYPSR